MSLKPKFIIDSQNDTAILDIYVEGIIVTTYTYLNNNVTLSERLIPVKVVLSVLQENISQIMTWNKLISNVIFPALNKRSRFHEDMKKKQNEMLASYKHKGEIVSDINFQEGNNFATFAARPEIKLGFNDFISWSNFLLRFYNECKSF